MREPHGTPEAQHRTRQSRAANDKRDIRTARACARQERLAWKEMCRGASAPPAPTPSPRPPAPLANVIAMRAALEAAEMPLAASPTEPPRSLSPRSRSRAPDRRSPYRTSTGMSTMFINTETTLTRSRESGSDAGHRTPVTRFERSNSRPTDRVKLEGEAVARVGRRKLAMLKNQRHDWRAPGPPAPASQERSEPASG